MEQKKRNAFLAIIGALILIIAVFVLLKKEVLTEKFVDYEALGIQEYEYPPEFSMGDNLETAITELALSFDNFDEDSVHN